MRTPSEDSQKAVSAAVIKRMGLATPGAQYTAGDAFNPNPSLTNWGNIRPEGRRKLFGRHGKDLSDNMDRGAECIKSGSEVFENPYGTSIRGAVLAYPVTIDGLLVTSQLGSVGLAAVGGNGMNALAKAMTAPPVS